MALTASSCCQPKLRTAHIRLRADGECKAFVRAGTTISGEQSRDKTSAALLATPSSLSPIHLMSTGTAGTADPSLTKYSNAAIAYHRVRRGPLVASESRLGIASGPMEARESAQCSARSGTDDVRASRVSSGIARRAVPARMRKANTARSLRDRVKQGAR